ncbi:hypothetical protein BEP19_09585 [Ammoniphilus oxalaticus]|uniref:Uncharacterized protein n=1 Tax=Ammoniphilus oxalaticus TaxID=66863 RepID=A0A419SKV2_9BACL|nr:hypothetical protein [Ammoniphilus oxalaticus]RKD24615.1 hypothetical protein BEP19_09585 [Ammoniphilus oxalaticus]
MKLRNMARLFALAAVCLLVICGIPEAGEAKETGRLTIRVKSSPDAVFETKLETLNKWFVNEIKKAPKQQTKAQPELPYGYVTLHGEQQDVAYVVSYALNLFDLERGVKVRLPQEAKEQLRATIQSLEEQHYGQAVTWKEASNIFPRMGFAEVVDIETGKTFNVQRRAGSQHADAQPLTAADTKTMKEIYQGKWSWKRRAVLVRVNGQTLAASMHGMPHGAGAIQNNDFPGHFCIHFKDSSTHRRKDADPAHDLMISKASGELISRLTQGTPEELMRLFATAINEQDEEIIKLLINRADSEAFHAFIQQRKQIEAVRLLQIDERAETQGSPFVYASSVELQLKLIGKREQVVQTTLHFMRGAPTGRWKLEAESLLTLFN